MCEVLVAMFLYLELSCNESKSLTSSYNFVFFTAAVALMAFMALNFFIEYGVTLELLCDTLNFEHKLHSFGKTQDVVVPIGDLNGEHKRSM